MWPFPDNDDHLADWDDPEPVERCGHDVPVTDLCMQCVARDLKTTDLNTVLAAYRERERRAG